jgi:hypothetical protein
VLGPCRSPSGTCLARRARCWMAGTAFLNNVTQSTWDCSLHSCSLNIVNRKEGDCPQIEQTFFFLKGIQTKTSPLFYY